MVIFLIDKPCYTDGRAKGGAKVHAVMNVGEGIPCMVKFSKAATSDVWYVTRLKDNVRYEIISTEPTKGLNAKGEGVVKDESISIFSGWNKTVV
jgi:hypothetical protein